MIDLETASQLKTAGLDWRPEILDYFGIPDRHMDERIFVISDMLVTVELLQGLQIVSFQGASEWALDYLVTTDAIWIPREDQLRKALEAALLESGRPEFRMRGGLAGYQCDLVFKEQTLSFQGDDASHVYAQALLHILSD
jgi:hypothetical protein